MQRGMRKQRKGGSMERLTANDLDKVCYDPWELCRMDSYCKKGCHENGGCTKGCHILKMYRKLAEYEDLEEQGKLLKLPCAVGDKLYFPYIDSVTKEEVISEEEVTEIGLYYRVENGELSNCSEIGNIIFTSKEQATDTLQTLKEEEEENGD